MNKNLNYLFWEGFINFKVTKTVSFEKTKYGCSFDIDSRIPYQVRINKIGDGDTILKVEEEFNSNNVIYIDLEDDLKIKELGKLVLIQASEEF